MESDKLFDLCINQMKLLKKYIITIKSMQMLLYNGYYIYELGKQSNPKPNIL